VPSRSLRHGPAASDQDTGCAFALRLRAYVEIWNLFVHAFDRDASGKLIAPAEPSLYGDGLSEWRRAQGVFSNLRDRSVHAANQAAAELTVHR